MNVRNPEDQRHQCSTVDEKGFETEHFDHGSPSILFTPDQKASVFFSRILSVVSLSLLPPSDGEKEVELVYR